MKDFLIGMWVFAFVATSQAQRVKNDPSNGVYLTLPDYLHQHLTHGFVHKTKGYHLRTPRMDRVKLITPDSTYLYELTQVFGYREDGIDWCYRSGQLVEIVGYQCLESGSHEGLWLYRRPEWAESSPFYTYFFSKNATDELQWVSRSKIKEAFRKDTAFLSLLKKVRWRRILDTSANTGQPLLLDVYATAHRLHFSLRE